MKIHNYRGNYQSDIKKNEILKIQIWASGYHGSLRLQKLVLKKLVSNYLNSPQIKIFKMRPKNLLRDPRKKSGTIYKKISS